MTSETNASSHDIHWKFFRAGGFDQVRLDSGAAVKALGKLDQKLWAALSCPTRGLEIDSRTLDLIDSDHDQRIRAGEVVAAVDWACALLKDADVLLKPGDVLALSAIEDATPQGRAVLAAAKRILAKSGKADAETISLDDVAGVEEVFAANDFNGDGIVPPEVVDDPALKAVVDDIILCLGGELDRSGLAGVSKDKVEEFFKAADAYAAWADRAEGDAELAPQGDASWDAYDAYRAVAAKIEDWFTRAALAAFDPRAAGPLNRSEEDWQSLAGALLDPASDALAAFPLAGVRAGDDLTLSAGLNPAWAAAMARFKDLVVVPLLGARDSLDAAGWAAIKDRWAPRAAWMAEAPDTPLVRLGGARLGVARIRAILADGAKAGILDLIARDLALKDEAAAIASVDKLLRLNRDLVTLLNNFVAFRDFYTRKHKAVFQAGTLFLDGRSCELCVKVEDPDKHAAIATLSRIYLVYCECKRRGEDEARKMFIAAAVTAGDADQLMVGRNGVFYDRQGGDWDATVVKIIEHSISIRQSFWSPYKKLGKLVTSQIEKMAAAKAAEPAVPLPAAAPAKPVAAAPPPPPARPGTAAPAAAAAPQPFDAGRFAGIFAAMGLAVGAIGTAVASVVTGFLSLPWWQIPLALAGVALAISGPSMLIASFKLHQRNLGPILDANGWAVNTHARINIPFGTALTQLAKLPEGAQRALKDPFAEKEPPWALYGTIAAMVVLAGLLWELGIITKLWALIPRK
jgi:hypothetical protein